MANFTDRVDVNYKISLYEYGIIRNPKTNKVIYCMNLHEQYDCFDGQWVPNIKTTFLGIDEIKERLEDIDNGFFSFIGSTRKEEIENLNNNTLSYLIMSINQYDGSLQDWLY